MCRVDVSVMVMVINLLSDSTFRQRNDSKV